jgi:phosphoglycerate dehydrogenase-like enzyme
LTIFAAVDVSTQALQRIRVIAAGNSVECRPCANADDVRDHIPPDTEVLLSRYLPDCFIAKKLKWVQTFGAGVDHLRAHPLARTNVLFTTSSGIHAKAISELVFAFLLYFQRSLGKIQQYSRLRKWPTPADLYTFFDRPELSGQTLGVVGYGSIGREVSRVATAFGLRVLGVRRNPECPPGLRFGAGSPAPDIVEGLYGMDRLVEVATETDYLVICLPLTSETRHCISRNVLRAMKPTAVLINVARGGVIDEVALVEALGEQRIAGAALDVYEQEPLPSGHPLYTLDNVLLSPHVAGARGDYVDQVIEVFITNLERFLGGKPLLNLVDWQREY